MRRYESEIRVSDNLTSSQSLRRQLASESDPELRHAIGVLWVEALAFERAERQAAESTWVVVDGLRYDGWWEAPGVYRLQHHTSMRVHDMSWCGRPIPVGWSRLRPAKKAKGKQCGACATRQARWSVWGD